MAYRFILLLLVCMTIISSCNKEEPPYVVNAIKLEEAVGVSDVSATLSALIESKHNFGNEAIFLVTKSINWQEDFVVQCEEISNGKYSATIDGLLPGTTYYYRLVLEKYISEWKSFTTLYDSKGYYSPLLSVVETTLNAITLLSKYRSNSSFLVFEETKTGEVLVEPHKIVNDYLVFSYVTLSDLKLNTIYTIKSFGEVSKGEGYSVERVLSKAIKLKVDDLGTVHII